MLYMFAGVGIKLDHYSGSQYNAGRKVPTSEMRRGDMLFWGPNASQHVAMYLGGGQMLEAPYTGSVVKVSPVRTSGMTPYATRLIEW
jgi:cell wall-associated NlpC family hydrolase